MVESLACFALCGVWTRYFTLQQVAGLLRRNMGYSLPLLLAPSPLATAAAAAATTFFFFFFFFFFFVLSSSDIAVGATKLVAMPPRHTTPHYTRKE